MPSGRAAASSSPATQTRALAALESALGHDPYNEFLYQKIMRLQAAAGHPEAVRRTLSLLEARLTDLGITPGPQTRHIAASLLGTQVLVANAVATHGYALPWLGRALALPCAGDTSEVP